MLQPARGTMPESLAQGRAVEKVSTEKKAPGGKPRAKRPDRSLGKLVMTSRGTHTSLQVRVT